MRAVFASAFALWACLGTPVMAQDGAVSCSIAGPQSPRDIGTKAGANALASFKYASIAESGMSLCNIHYHARAEHFLKGVFDVKSEAAQGFACNAAASLTDDELGKALGEEEARELAHGPCAHLKVGDTVEVHWVYTSCAIDEPERPEVGKPLAGLGACLPAACTDPVLRVEAQVFVVVNDPGSQRSVDFRQFGYGGETHMLRDGRVQTFLQPRGFLDLATAVSYRGSTTGPSYDAADKCSPAKVTWAVQPSCQKVSIQSMHEWCATNRYGEKHGHKARALVTAPALLAPME